MTRGVSILATGLLTELAALGAPECASPRLGKMKVCLSVSKGPITCRGTPGHPSASAGHCVQWVDLVRSPPSHLVLGREEDPVAPRGLVAVRVQQ